MSTESVIDIYSYIGGAATAILIQSVYWLKSYYNKNKKSQDNITLISTAEEDGNNEIKNELFSRIMSYFGPEKFSDLQNSFVIVVGLGGVGSHAANMLVRSGVKRLRIIDFDQVTLSSLNRHAVATLSDVGLSKPDVVRRHFNRIVPWCEVEPVTEMFKWESADRLLEGAPDYVLDCIDDVNTKAELLAYCTQKGIRVLTSMGAGGKGDPTRMRISPLSECVKDPLATKIKWKLKKHDVSPEDVMTVYSVEKPVCNLLPLDAEQSANPAEFGAVENFRLRVMPVLGTSPAVFGQAMASYVLCSLGGCLYDAESGERLSKNVRHKMRQILTTNEKRRFGSADLDLDDDDIEFIVGQVWKTRCSVTGRRIGGSALMVLTRWDPSQPPTPYNLVLVQQNVAKLIEASPLGGRGVESISSDVVERIEKRLQWSKDVCANDWPPVDNPVVTQALDIKQDDLEVVQNVSAQSARLLTSVSAFMVASILISRLSNIH
eukprot:CAMPEP_0185033010 /NCGR_PEP_ID=MMETSP1103-20130426/21604_1 /TAXON_ID=36769 /ORGANISM="Paraphysomonas bandaiensis, Strain Caron Lab Isolate" /LENGTH=489 /DNA_ID=CAMNT_0027569131 /DNA_START=8 /DNA_END=1477 /DNA_ORIENTATION=-